MQTRDEIVFEAMRANGLSDNTIERVVNALKARDLRIVEKTYSLHYYGMKPEDAKAFTDNTGNGMDSEFMKENHPEAYNDYVSGMTTNSESQPVSDGAGDSDKSE